MGVFEPGNGRRRGASIVLAFGVIAAMFVAFAPQALAVHDLKFQLDGNTADDVTATFDWENFFDASGTGGTIGTKVALPSASLPDFSASGFATSGGKPGDFYLPDETTFSTGSKDTLNISTGWQCGKSNNVGDKVDIVNAYATVYTNPGDGHTILYFGIEKSSPNGDSNVAVWFLQDDKVACDATGGGNVSFTGNHEDGDLLLVSAFTNGGTSANVAAYKWNGGASGSLGASPVATGGLCPAPATTDPTGSHACAITNATTAISPPWKHPDKDCCGKASPNPALNPLEFFEGGVDLTATGIGDACFARFLANTRSSQSLTATIFDFAAGNLQTCAPSTALTVSADKSVVHAGETVTVTITENNDGINALTSPSVTVDSNTADTCTPSYVSGDDGNGDLDVGETWTFTCAVTPTVDTTLTFTGHGLDPRGKDVSFDATDCASISDGDISISGDLVCDSDEQGSAGYDVINPGTDLSAHVTATYTFYEKNTGDGPLDNPTVTGTGCTTTQVLESTNTYNAGDGDKDGVFDPGETWRWECTVTRTSSGTSNVSAIGSGTDSADTAKTITWCTDPGSPPAGTICNQAENASGSVTLDSNADPAP